jgi:AcrR family transcriptional regulator
MSPRAGLSPDRVTALGLALVDRDGVDALSLARVAESAGVATPSLYKHVGGLPDLRDRVSVRVVAELTTRVRDAVIGVSGDDGVRGVLRAYRDYLVEYPHRAPFLVNPAASAPAGELLDVVLSVLRGFGLTGAPAVHAARTLRAVAHGFAVLQAGGGFGLPEDLAESFELLADTVVAGLRQIYLAS